MIPGNANPLLLASAAAAAAAVEGPIKSLRFNSGDSAYLNRTPSSAGNRKIWTWSGWIKRNKLGSDQTILEAYTTQTDTGYIQLKFRSADSLSIAGWNTNWKITTQVFRDVSAWMHLVVAFDVTQATGSDRIKFYVNGQQITDFGTDSAPSQNTDHAVNNSIAHYVGYSAGNSGQRADFMLADVYLIDGSALDATSFGAFDDNGVWQAAEYSGTFGTNGFHLLDFANESTVGHDSSGNENDFTANNLVAAVGKAFTTAKIYSVYASATVSSNYSVQYSDDNSNWTTAFSGVISNNGAFGLQSGTNPGDGSYGPRKYWRYVTGSVVSTHHPRCSRIVLSDGVDDVNIQVFTSDNTSDTGTIPAEGDTYTYTDTTAAADIDVLFDAPTNGTQSDTGAGGEVSGNYCTMNPLDNDGNTLSDGNLKIVTSSSSETSTLGTIGVSSGKWYYEVQATSVSGTYWLLAGFSTENDGNSSGAYLFQNDGTKYNNGSSSSYGSSLSVNDVLGVAFNADDGEIAFYINGVSQGTAFTSIPAGTYLPLLGEAGGAANSTMVVNFGQRAFAYSAPSGYKALCTTNLPTPTIADGSDYFDTLLWTGDGASSTREITGLSMENAPDWIWAKQRSGGSSHATFDAVRGFGSNNVLKTNSSDAEAGSNGGYINSTSATSITWAQGTSSAEFYDLNNETYVAWCWDAGSSTASNTDGSITSSVRANQSAGFSIVSYTGTGSNATVGHGLNAVPELIILKDRDAAKNWAVSHKDLSSNAHYLILNSTDAEANTFPYWNGDHTSSVFTLGNTGGSNESGDDFIAYCFAPVAGYSAFGTYEGNSDFSAGGGPFISMDFAPAFLIIKNTETAANWLMFDNKRPGYNLNNDVLYPNLSDVEGSSLRVVDLLSNGFKVRPTSSTTGSRNDINNSGDTYIWAAWASNPFQANGGLAR